LTRKARKNGPETSVFILLHVYRAGLRTCSKKPGPSEGGKAPNENGPTSLYAGRGGDLLDQARMVMNGHKKTGFLSRLPQETEIL
jgi:hypothetical protein